MSTTPHDGIAVGYDGSSESRTAAAWALEEARRSGARLTLVTVVRPGDEGLDPWATSAQFLRELGHRTSDPELDHLRRAAPGTEIRAVVRIGSPRVELARAARSARVLALGLRRRVQLARDLTGSVTGHVLRDTTTSVALIPHVSPDDAAVAGTARVLALVGPHSSGHVVDAAIEEARLRGGEVSVVRATREPSGALIHHGAVRGTWARSSPGHPASHLPVAVWAGTAGDFLRHGWFGPSDLVVLGRHHHPHGAHLLVDGTLTSVLTRPRCAVLVVADDGARDTAPAAHGTAVRSTPAAPAAVTP